MDTTAKQIILKQLVNDMTDETETIQPENIDIQQINAITMDSMHSLITRDKNYYIRYGGNINTGNYIEVYTMDSFNSGEPLYTFNVPQANGEPIQPYVLKQATDGRFYGLALRRDSIQMNLHEIFVIFNNFIQDGFLQLNKYYTEQAMGITLPAGEMFTDIIKKGDEGIYYISTKRTINRFEINILEGNKNDISVVNYDWQLTGGEQTQLNIVGDTLVFTQLAIDEESYSYEYMRAMIDITKEEMPAEINGTNLYYVSFPSSQYVKGAINEPFRAVIPWLNSSGKLLVTTIEIDGTTIMRQNTTRTFNNNTNLYVYMKDNYVTCTDNTNIYLFYFNRQGQLNNLIEFDSAAFSGKFDIPQIIIQFNLVYIIGTSTGSQQKITIIKNLYSPGITTAGPYYTKEFAKPTYINIYSNKLIFSRNVISSAVVGNQINTTFIVPNYMLNENNIKRINVFGKTKYLLNVYNQPVNKNQFESLYYNYIYLINVMDNTNGLNIFNKNGSNTIAESLGANVNISGKVANAKLTKAKITYKNYDTEIIPLNIPETSSTSVTFSYSVSGNITSIAYISEDERTTYATIRQELTGTHTITQTIRIE